MATKVLLGAAGFALLAMAALGLLASLAASTAQISANAAIMQAQLLACLMIPVAGAAGFGIGYLVYAVRQHFKRAKRRGIEPIPSRQPVSMSALAQPPASAVPPQLPAPVHPRRHVRVVTSEMLAYLTHLPGWGWDVPDERRR